MKEKFEENAFPKQINIVWLGNIPHEEVLQNAIDWKAKNPNYDIRIWIDSSLYEFPHDEERQKEIQEKIAQFNLWAKKNKIVVYDISNESRGNIDKYKYIQSNSEVIDCLKEVSLMPYYYDEVIGDNKNYAAASDILRVIILYLYGGFYVDAEDVFPGELSIDEALAQHEGTYDFLYHSRKGGNTKINQSNLDFNNDIMGSIPKGKTITTYLKHIIKNYKELYLDPEQLSMHRSSLMTLPGEEDSRLKSTSKTSGPNCLMKVLFSSKGHHFSEIPPSSYRTPAKQSLSWLDTKMNEDPTKVAIRVRYYVSLAFINEIDRALEKVNEDLDKLKDDSAHLKKDLAAKIERVKEQLLLIKEVLKTYPFSMNMLDMYATCTSLLTEKEQGGLQTGIGKINTLFNNLMVRFYNCSLATEELCTFNTKEPKDVSKILNNITPDSLERFVDLAFNTNNAEPNYENLDLNKVFRLKYNL